MCSVLYKRGFEPPSSQSMSKEKLRNIANIGIQSYITNFSQKCFIFSACSTVLCTERFERPHSLTTSKKKLGNTANINIWSYNLKFSEEAVLYFHLTALCYVQCAQKKLKIASFIELPSFRIHITIINTPYHALKFSKIKCFIRPFLLCLYCLVICAGCASNEYLNPSMEHV